MDDYQPIASSSSLPAPSFPSTPAKVKRVKKKSRKEVLPTGDDDEDALTPSRVALPSSPLNGDLDLPESSKKAQRREKRQAGDAMNVDTPNRRVTEILQSGGDAENLVPASAGKKKRRRDGDKEREQLADDAAGPEWNCCEVAVGEISRLAPVWTPDGRYYFKAQGSMLMIHSSKAPDFQLISTLPSPYSDPSSSTSTPTLDGHTAPITAFSLHPINPFEIITSSYDGTIKVWDWTEGKLVRTIKVDKTPGKLAVDRMCVGFVDEKAWVYVSTFHAGPSPSKQDHYKPHEIIRIPLQPSLKAKAKSLNLIERIQSLDRAPSNLSLSPLGNYLLITSLSTIHLHHLASSTTLPFVSPRSITCAAWAPAEGRGVPSILRSKNAEEIFATGDSMGMIRLWYGIGEAFRNDAALKAQGRGVVDEDEVMTPSKGKGKKTGRKPGEILGRRLPSREMHWHAHEVSSLVFSSSGAVLLSGGQENVMVKWEVESGKKDFVARLGTGGIVYIGVKRVSEDGGAEEYWVGLQDGTNTRIGTQSGSIIGVGKGARLDPVYPLVPGRSVPLSYHPGTRSLILPSSHPSTIQFYQPSSGSVLFDLEVAPSNRVSRKEDKEVEPVRVERVVLSAKGTWMATSESREGDESEGGGKARALKIWKWENDSYVLITHVPRSHGMANITSMAFTKLPSTTTKKTSDPMLLTTADDATAKLWTIKRAVMDVVRGPGSQRVKGYEAEAFWALRSTFQYQNLPIHDSSFSHDGTLLALAQGSVITLWDTQSNVLLKVLDIGDLREVSKIGFVDMSSRYLAVAGQGMGLGVMDFLICDYTWVIPDHPIHQLLTSATSSTFLTSSLQPKRAVLNAFTPLSSTPVSTRQIKHSLLFLHLAQSASTISGIEMVGLTTSGQILRIGDQVEPFVRPIKAVNGELDEEEEQRVTIWEEMFGKGALGNSVPIKPIAGSTGASKNAQKRSKCSNVFDGPAQTLPPVDLLFDQFMDDFFNTAPAVTPLEDEDEAAAEPTEIIHSDALNVDMEEAEKEGRVFIENEMVLPQVQKKGRVIGDNEVEEMTGFFRKMLNDLPGQTMTAPAAAAPKLNKKSSKSNLIVPASAPTSAKKASEFNTNMKSRKEQEAAVAAAALAELKRGAEVGKKRKAVE